MGKKRDICPIGLPEDIKSFTTEALTCFDGQYKLFYGERSFPYGFRKCSLAVSANLLDWKKQKSVIKPRFLEPACIDAGTAMPRNGKTVYLYLKKSLLGDSIHMVSTADFIHFEKHPVPVLTKKHLPKKAKGLSAPRVVKSGGFYYMTVASGMRKGGMVLLYRSSNLTDWGLRGMLSCETQSCPGKAGYPALIQSNGAHILLEKRIYKGAEVFGYRIGSVRLDEGCFTPFSEFKSLDNMESPRISTLPDGRIILISGLPNIGGDCDRLALPKEVIYGDNGLLITPVRELYGKRTNERAAAFTAREWITEVSGVSGKSIELNVFADMSLSNKFRIMAFMAGCRGLFIDFYKDKGVAEFDFSTLVKKNKDKCPVVKVPLKQWDKLDVQLILLSDRFECFINGGEFTVSRGIDSDITGAQIGFDAEGEVPCEIVAYNIV